MAKARETAPDPPVESEDESGEEEEEEGSSEEENGRSESESEPEHIRSQSSQNAKKPSSTPAPAPAPAPKKPEPAAPKTQPPAAVSSSSSEDEESGSESESDSPPTKTDSDIKPLASKPMDDPQKSTTTRKPRSKPNPSGPTSPTKPTTGAGAKRAAAGDETKDAKRSKKKSEAETENSERKGSSTDDSKKLFQRLWSEDDEIAILKGMIDYSAKKKADPVTDLNAFHEFIKKNLHIDVSRTQLQDKIRRLRKKYENNASKEKKGKERTFSKDHEQKAYDLSKKIWGTEKYGEEEPIETSKVNGTPIRKSRSKSAVGTISKVDELEEKVKEVKNLVGEKNVEELKKSACFVPDSSGIEGWVLTDGMEFMKVEKRVEMGEKWKELRVKETELLAWKLELMLEQTKLILDGLKSSGH